MVVKITVFNKYGEALTTCESYATYVLQNASCHIGEEPEHTKRVGRLAQTPPLFFTGCESLPQKSVFKLRKRTVSFEMFSTPTLRNMMDGSGFKAGQWVRFYLSDDTTLKDGVIRFKVC
ncbi:hypothetical protein Tco_0969195 [Tanacetum coccineum]